MLEEKQCDIFAGSAIGSIKHVKYYIDQSKNSKKCLENLVDIKGLQKDDGITALSWGNEDQTEILLARRNGQIQFYNTQRGMFTKSYTANFGSGSVVGLGLHERKLLAGMFSGVVKIWGKTEETIVSVCGNIDKMKVCSEDTTMFATGGEENDLKVWRIGESVPIFNAKNRPHDWLQMRMPVWVSDLTFLPGQGGNLLAVCSRHGYIRLYDIRMQRRPVCTVEYAKGMAATCLEPSFDSRCVLVGFAHGQLHQIDLRKAIPDRGFKGNVGCVTSIGIHRQLRLVVSSDLDRHLCVHNFDTKEMLHKMYVTSRPTRLLVQSENTTPLRQPLDEQEKQELKYSDTEALDQLFDVMEPISVKRRRTEALEESDADEASAAAPEDTQNVKPSTEGSTDVAIEDEEDDREAKIMRLLKSTERQKRKMEKRKREMKARSVFHNACRAGGAERDGGTQRIRLRGGGLRQRAARGHAGGGGLHADARRRGVRRRHADRHLAGHRLHRQPRRPERRGRRAQGVPAAGPQRVPAQSGARHDGPAEPERQGDAVQLLRLRGGGGDRREAVAGDESGRARRGRRRPPHEYPRRDLEQRGELAGAERRAAAARDVVPERRPHQSVHGEALGGRPAGALRGHLGEELRHRAQVPPRGGRAARLRHHLGRGGAVQPHELQPRPLRGGAGVAVRLPRVAARVGAALGGAAPGERVPRHADQQQGQAPRRQRPGPRLRRQRRHDECLASECQPEDIRERGLLHAERGPEAGSRHYLLRLHQALLPAQLRREDRRGLIRGRHQVRLAVPVQDQGLRRGRGGPGAGGAGGARHLRAGRRVQRTEAGRVRVRLRGLGAEGVQRDPAVPFEGVLPGRGRQLHVVVGEPVRGAGAGGLREGSPEGVRRGQRQDGAHRGFCGRSQRDVHRRLPQRVLQDRRRPRGQPAARVGGARAAHTAHRGRAGLLTYLCVAVYYLCPKLSAIVFVICGCLRHNGVHHAMLKW